MEDDKDQIEVETEFYTFVDAGPSKRRIEHAFEYARDPSIRMTVNLMLGYDIIVNVRVTSFSWLHQQSKSGGTPNFQGIILSIGRVKVDEKTGCFHTRFTACTDHEDLTICVNYNEGIDGVGVARINCYEAYFMRRIGFPSLVKQPPIHLPVNVRVSRFFYLITSSS